AARPALAVDVLADRFTACPVKDHDRPGAAPASPARLAESVGRESAALTGAVVMPRVLQRNSSAAVRKVCGKIVPMNGGFALRAYEPLACRVYPPATAP